MARTGDNIIPFDGNRGSSRSSGDGSRSAAASRRGSSAAREPRGLDSSERLDPLERDPFGRSRTDRDPFAGVSRVSRSGRVSPVRPSDARPAVDAPRAASSRFDDDARTGSRRRDQGSRPSSVGGISLAGASRRPARPLDDSPFAPDSFDRGAGGRGSSRGAVRPSASFDEDAAPRSALQSYDEFLEEEDERGASGRGSRRRKADADHRKKQKAKSKAEKMFTRQFGDDSAAAAPSGSRAAVYKGEMGKNHKRAFADLSGKAGLSTLFSLFGKGSSGSAARGAQSGSRSSKSGIPRSAIAAAVLVCVVFSGVFLYPIAQQYYIELRSQARLQAEYTALSERNESIQSEIDHLSTDEGVKDAAREQLGWVDEGDVAVTVEGLEEDPAEAEKSAVYAQVANGSVKTPATWYSPVLDVVFGYSDGVSDASSSGDSAQGSEASGSSADGEGTDGGTSSGDSYQE